MNLTKNFTIEEMRCPCCGECKMDPYFMSTLQSFRDWMGPLRVTSGYRCKEYNNKIGGAKNSMHVQGKAADLVWISARHDMLREALGIFNGIGIHSEFLHVDTRNKKTLWVYSGVI